MARLKQEKGRISSRDRWKHDEGHLVVFSGMSWRKKKKRKPVVSLMLTEANPQGMSFGKAGVGGRETCCSQGIPSTAAAVSTRLQILAGCGHWQVFPGSHMNPQKKSIKAHPFSCKSPCPEPVLVNTDESRSECWDCTGTAATSKCCLSNPEPHSTHVLCT